MKLAEVAANPFGEDDDDFDIIGLFDNHVNVSHICLLLICSNCEVFFLQVADNLLVVFDLNENNPVLESMELTHLTRVTKFVFFGIMPPVNRFVFPCLQFKIHKGEALLPMNGEKPSETLNPKGEETPLMLPYIVSDESYIELCGLDGKLHRDFLN